MRLGSPERGVEAGLVHRAVDERRGGAGGREGPPGGRCHDVGPGLVEPAFQREDVALQPGQQVQAGSQPGVRQLWQVGVEVDQPGEQHPAGERQRRRGLDRTIRRGAGEGDPPVRVDDQEPVRLVAGPAVGERCQQPGTEGEGRSLGEDRCGRHGRRC